MKIIIASDSFKGSLTSSEVAEAAASGIREIWPECQIISLDVADGGEGTADALLKILGGTVVETEAHDPLMRPLKAKYGIIDGGKTAVIEMSAASGLVLLAENERNPLKTTTFGTGEMILDACRRGCRRFLIGIGGSATNDAGTGMLSALGVKFYGNDGRILQGTGEDLERIAEIDLSGIPQCVTGSEFTVACDVENPFCGPDGAVYVFAPQKGADSAMAGILENGMQAFAEKTRSVTGCDMVQVKGAGAAGGLGGAFMAYLDARLVSGAEMILETVRFDQLIRDADLVITGEGCIDFQTGMGKIPYRILGHAAAKGIPVIAVAGKIEADVNPGFSAMYAVTPESCPPDKAMQPEVARQNVRNTVASIVRTLHAAFDFGHERNERQ